MDGAQQHNPGARFLLVAASLVVVVAGLRAAGAILLPLFVAVFLAILSSPLLAWLIRHRFPRFLAVVVTVLANIAVLAALLLLVGGSVNAFSAALPKYLDRLDNMTSSSLAWLRAQGIDVSELNWLEPLAAPADDDTAPALIGIDAIVNLATTTLRGAAAIVSNSFLVLLTMIFLLFEATGLPRKLQIALDWDETALARLIKAKSDIQRYLGIKTLISLLTGVLLGLWVALLGVDFPVLWGLIAFLLNYIPSLGSILAAIPTVLLALIDLGLGPALVVGAGYLVVNLSLGNFLEPHLMGRRFGLSTLVVFLSLVFWGWVWGPVGMLLSVPLTMILKIILENTEDLRWLALLLSAKPRQLLAAQQPTSRSRGLTS